MKEQIGVFGGGSQKTQRTGDWPTPEKAERRTGLECKRPEGAEAGCQPGTSPEKAAWLSRAWSLRTGAHAPHMFPVSQMCRESSLRANKAMPQLLAACRGSEPGASPWIQGTARQRGPSGAHGISQAAQERRNLPWLLARFTRVSSLNICLAQMTRSHAAKHELSLYFHLTPA